MIWCGVFVNLIYVDVVLIFYVNDFALMIIRVLLYRWICWYQFLCVDDGCLICQYGEFNLSVEGRFFYVGLVHFILFDEFSKTNGRNILTCIKVWFLYSSMSLFSLPNIYFLI